MVSRSRISIRECRKDPAQLCQRSPKDGCWRKESCQASCAACLRFGTAESKVSPFLNFLLLHLGPFATYVWVILPHSCRFLSSLIVSGTESRTETTKAPKSSTRVLWSSPLSVALLYLEPLGRFQCWGPGWHVIDDAWDVMHTAYVISHNIHFAWRIYAYHTLSMHAHPPHTNTRFGESVQGALPFSPFASLSHLTFLRFHVLVTGLIRVSSYILLFCDLYSQFFFFKRILNLSKFGLLVFACDLRRGQGRGVGLWQWILAKKYVVVVVDPDAALSAAAIRCAWGCLGGGLFESVACVDYEMRRIIILTCGMMCCSRLFTPEGREPFVRVIWLSNPLHAVIWCNMTMNLLFVQLRSRHIRSQFAWVLNVRKVLLFLTTWRSCKSSLRIPWFLSCFRRDDLELQWFLFSYTSSIPYPTSRIQRCVAK